MEPNLPFSDVEAASHVIPSGPRSGDGLRPPTQTDIKPDSGVKRYGT
jgi:hypothetical protein